MPDFRWGSSAICSQGMCRSLHSSSNWSSSFFHLVPIPRPRTDTWIVANVSFLVFTQSSLSASGVLGSKALRTSSHRALSSSPVMFEFDSCWKRFAMSSHNMPLLAFPTIDHIWSEEFAQAIGECFGGSPLQKLSGKRSYWPWLSVNAKKAIHLVWQYCGNRPTLHQRLYCRATPPLPWTNIVRGPSDRPDWVDFVVFWLVSISVARMLMLVICDARTPRHSKLQMMQCFSPAACRSKWRSRW